MNKDDISERMNFLLAARVRRLIRWGKMHGQIDGANPLPAQIINKGFWQLWGYVRLRDCLVEELGMGLKDAMAWTAAAIGKGHEDGSKYDDGNKYDDGQQPGPASPTSPGGASPGAGSQRAGNHESPGGGGRLQPGGGPPQGTVTRRPA